MYEKWMTRLSEALDRAGGEPEDLSVLDRLEVVLEQMRWNAERQEGLNGQDLYLEFFEDTKEVLALVERALGEATESIALLSWEVFRRDAGIAQKRPTQEAMDSLLPLFLTHHARLLTLTEKERRLLNARVLDLAVAADPGRVN